MAESLLYKHNNLVVFENNQESWPHVVIKQLSLNFNSIYKKRIFPYSRAHIPFTEVKNLDRVLWADILYLWLQLQDSSNIAE